MGNTIIEDVRTLYIAAFDGLKIGADKKKLNDIIEIGSILIMSVIIVVFHVLSLIA